jgi:hypothetical protein
VIQRDIKAFWEPAGVQKQDQNLLILSTISGGFAIEKIVELDANLNVTDLNEYDPDRLTVMTGSMAYQPVDKGRWL